MLITLNGIQASGKSTLKKKLIEFLEAKDDDIWVYGGYDLLCRPSTPINDKQKYEDLADSVKIERFVKTRERFLQGIEKHDWTIVEHYFADFYDRTYCKTNFSKCYPHQHACIDTLEMAVRANLPFISEGIHFWVYVDDWVRQYEYDLSRNPNAPYRTKAFIQYRMDYYRQLERLGILIGINNSGTLEQSFESIMEHIENELD